MKREMGSGGEQIDVCDVKALQASQPPLLPCAPSTHTHTHTHARTECSSSSLICIVRNTRQRSDSWWNRTDMLGSRTDPFPHHPGLFWTLTSTSEQFSWFVHRTQMFSRRFFNWKILNPWKKTISLGLDHCRCKGIGHAGFIDNGPHSRTQLRNVFSTPLKKFPGQIWHSWKFSHLGFVLHLDQNLRTLNSSRKSARLFFKGWICEKLLVIAFT